MSGPTCAFLVLVAGCAGPFVLLTVEQVRASRDPLAAVARRMAREARRRAVRR